MEKIITCIERIAGKYSAYEVFTDWIRCMALGISNSLQMIHDKIWQEREQVYIDTMRKYTEPERIQLCEMLTWLTKILDEGPDDVLGKIYMRSGMGSKAAGQFFTPFHLSELCARFSLDTEQLQQTETPIAITEPSCGGGGMIIAAAKVLKDVGINYQKRMRVVAQDLDWKGVYMCYVQLSLLGISAVCVQGSTLSDPYDPSRTGRAHVLYTPARMGVLM